MTAIDPTYYILVGFTNKLASISYNSITYTVLTNLPKVDNYEHILLRDVRLTDAMTADTYMWDGEIDIEIINGGKKQQGDWIAVGAVAMTVFQRLIKQSITVGSHTVTVTPYLQSTNIIEEQLDEGTIVRKIITLNFHLDYTP